MTPNDPSGAGSPPGSVAEEAALLVDLLSQRGWGGSPRMPSGARRAPGGAAHASSTADSSPHARSTDDSSAHGCPEGAGPRGADGAGPVREGNAHECSCGGTTPAACRVCPLCQLIAFVQQVNPDTIDRVADLVGFAATALRDLATAQRERRSPRDDGENDTKRPGDPS